MSCADEIGAAGPTPWHLPKFPNSTLTDGKKTWKNLELKSRTEFRVGLVNEREELLLLIGFYWYSCAMTADRMLFWRQYKPESALPGEPGQVQFHLVDLNALSPITDVEAALVSSDYRKAGIYHSRTPVVAQNYLAGFRAGTTKISVPPELLEAGKVLVIADIGSAVGYNAEAHISILEFDFPKQCVTSYPQDWFNKGSLDIGYQWISRVWRDPQGRLCGEGVRIGEFRLDSTGRHLDRSFFELAQ